MRPPPIRRPAAASLPIQRLAESSAERPAAYPLPAIAHHAIPPHVPITTPGRSALPDRLRSGIERLSGIAMDDVRVHYDSPAPARLQALAYARGNDIHLAAGQERHLPHEAWHVVQQKQGRVRSGPAMAGDVAINDDAGLEREATAMGARALQARATTDRSMADPPASPRRVRPGDGAIQRVLAPVPYVSTYVGPYTAPKYANAVNQFRDALNVRVYAAYEQALRWQTLAGVTTPHVAKWYRSALGYATNPDLTPRIINANFGYAIEEIACTGLANSVQHGLKITTQVGHGHTRPDVVASIHDTEVAWFDITSVASTGHIRFKSGAGWRMTPYIYELVYPRLRLSALLDATDDPYYSEFGAMLADERQAKEQVQHSRRQEIANSFLDLRDDNDWHAGVGSAANKKNETRTHFDEIAEHFGIDDLDTSARATRGALADLDIANGPFGFNVGEEGSTNVSLTRLVNESTAEDVEGAQQAVRAPRTEANLARMEQSGIWRDQVLELQALAVDEPGSRDIALRTMLLMGAMHDFENLDRAGDALSAFATDPLEDRLREDIMAAMENGPEIDSQADIARWRRHAADLKKRHGEILEMIDARETLRAAVVDVPALQIEQVQGWYRQLHAYPPDMTVVRAVEAWVHALQPQQEDAMQQ